MRLGMFLLIALVGALPMKEQETPRRTVPMLIHRVEPEYTRDAVNAKLEGTVVLSTVIQIDGVPSEVKVVRGLGMGLDEKAVDCLKLWRFNPAALDGELIPMHATVKIAFHLPNSR